MGEHQQSRPDGTPAPDAPPRRIETQIHRRKKAKALSPLTAEWDVRRPDVPSKLRMPSSRMRKVR
ncbi:MAG: hypothetical protein A3A88_03350 [Nitrospirae bacterium RIFCSPLOWO2_01_FULL_62_17]|nr:MAG: hypothetical protein A3A88_03350 [Nitrospirae bacterium RIFCSPLOWO2_01_FULL_62_17]